MSGRKGYPPKCEQTDILKYKYYLPSYAGGNKESFQAGKWFGLLLATSWIRNVILIQELLKCYVSQLWNLQLKII